MKGEACGRGRDGHQVLGRTPEGGGSANNEMLKWGSRYWLGFDTS